MHPFRKYIQTYSSLREEEWKKVEACLERRFYQKGDLILRSGKICRKLYFLEEGFLRYFSDKDGLEVTKYFTEAPYCFTSQRSFNNEIPSGDSIIAECDSIIWQMKRKDSFDLLKIFNWSEFVRILVQEVQYFTEQILEEMQNSTAESRYIRMIEENNVALRYVSLQDIASYLGIAPQSLSRIRKKYQADARNLT